jgi:histidine triad (HIT) family protein
MASIFTKIINREIPAYIVAEDEKFISFLDNNPLAIGHTLVIPKREEDYIFDLSDVELAELVVFSKRVAKAIQSVVPCKRIGISVFGLEVPHVHVHLVPLNLTGDINFAKPKLSLSKEEFILVTQKIKSAFE